MYVLAQIVGIIGVITFLLSYQFKKRKNIIIVNALSNFLYILQYVLLGAFEGAVIELLSVVSTVTAHKKDKEFVSKHIKAVVIGLNLLIFLGGLSLYKDIFSLCPIAGAMLQTGAFWITNEKRIRQVSFCGTPFWLVYNLVSNAYGAAVGSFLSMVSIGLAIYRYDVRPKNAEGAGNV